MTDAPVRRPMPPPPRPRKLCLPTRPRGRLSGCALEDYLFVLEHFCDWIKKKAASMDFKVGARGWCYILENEGVISKGEFDKAQRLITECRKDGLLPLDICIEDDDRAADFVEELDDDDTESYARGWIDAVLSAHENWKPISFWGYQDYYIEMATEKQDLKSLFAEVCERYHVPITNFKGWADLHSRAGMAERFSDKEAEGKQCILLVCGDHDPGGLLITDMLRKNFEDLSKATGWTPEGLEIVRFGLNFDFIKKNKLSWIHNLETSSGNRLDDPKHPDHDKDYVQDYLQRYGARKVEGNALVTRPNEGRQLAENAVRKYIYDAGITQYETELAQRREELRREIRKQIRRIPSR